MVMTSGWVNSIAFMAFDESGQDRGCVAFGCFRSLLDREGRLYRFDDYVSICSGITSPDESDGIRNPGLEFKVGLAGDLGFRKGGKALIECADGFRRVRIEKLLGLPDMAGLEIGLKKLEDIKDAGDPAGKGEIHGFYFSPVGEGPVADDEGIGVTDPGNEI